MNIVLLSDNGFVNGGAAKVALAEARGLAEAGHRVHFVFGVGPASVQMQGCANLELHCLNLHDVNQDPNRLRAITKGLWNPYTRQYLSRLLAKLDPAATIVHAHSWTRALSSSALRAVIDHKYELVITMHDYLLACPNGTFFQQNEARKCELKPMSPACLLSNCDAQSYQHKVWRVVRKAVQTAAAGIPSRAGHFIYLSKLAGEVMRPYLPEFATLHHLANPIEVDYAEPTSVSANKYFMYLGRLVREKGVELFARAAAAEGVACRFVGEGEASSAIQAACPEAVVSGWMKPSEVVNALRSARALVFPSLWFEGLPLTVLEAAALGVPSIVSDECAARESVIDGVTGLHFRDGDQADLQAKIRILDDPETAARMGKAAHEHFWAPPGWSVALHIQRLEEIYRRILAGRQVSGATYKRAPDQLLRTIE